MTDNNLRESTMVEPVRRRRFTKAEKAVIVAEYAAAATSTERGMVLRRHGTFQQNVSRWTKELNMASKPAKTASREEARLAKQLAAAEAKLAKANAEVALLTELVAAQGKVLGLHAKKPGSPHQG